MARTYMPSPNHYSTSRMIGILLVVALLAFGLYFILTMPDNRTLGERLDQAATDVKEGNLGDAAQTFERRTPGEKLGDAVEDAGENIKENTDNR